MVPERFALSSFQPLRILACNMFTLTPARKRQEVKIGPGAGASTPGYAQLQRVSVKP